MVADICCRRRFVPLLLRSSVLSLLIATAGLALVLVGQSMVRSGEPQIDFSSIANPSHLPAAEATGTIHFAVAAMVSADSTFSSYDELVKYICASAGQKHSFVLRPTYAAVREGLEDGEIEVAMVCTGTYLHSQASGLVRLLAQPEFTAGRTYRSIIIVSANNPARSIEELEGQTIAFTDRESNTGYIVPCVSLAEMGFPPREHFERTVFTRSHDRSILAVTGNIVAAAAVDSLVLESAIRDDPTLADRVRIIWSSKAFGPPPVVISAAVGPELEDKFRRAFLSMHEDHAGRQLLQNLGIERFIAPRHEDYLSAAQILERFQKADGALWP